MTELNEAMTIGYSVISPCEFRKSNALQLTLSQSSRCVKDDIFPPRQRAHHSSIPTYRYAVCTVRAMCQAYFPPPICQGPLSQPVMVSCNPSVLGCFKRHYYSLSETAGRFQTYTYKCIRLHPLSTFPTTSLEGLIWVCLLHIMTFRKSINEFALPIHS